MKCIDPVICYTSHQDKKKHYRNFSVVRKYNPWRLQLQHQVFNCNKCLVCRKKKAYELAVRCVLHASLYQHNCFLTLTYDETKSTYHNRFEYPDIQKFKKKLRQHCVRHHKGKKIEIFNVHEYGKNGKKHWHLLVFNHDFEDKILHTRKNNIPLYTSQTLSDLWTFGFNTVGDVSEGSAMYQAQYMEKDIKNGNLMSHKKSHSKHSGLGKPFFTRHYKQILSLGYIPVASRKVPLPRYFQKLAHKHFCHFYEKSAFFDNKERKALHRPFKKEEPNLEMANLYINFKHQKEKLVQEFEKDWQDVISRYFNDKVDPDFKKSGDNLLYDLARKNHKGDF